MSRAFYDDPERVRRYQAHRHDPARSPNLVMEEPALWRELGDVRGLRVLDLGCGDASIGISLLAAGSASYLGVDSSLPMVEAARASLAGSDGTVLQSDLESLAVPTGSFDLVISRLALHYVMDVVPVLAACRAGLVPGGRLVFSVLHPVLTAARDDPAVAPPAGSPGAEAGAARAAPAARTSWLVDDYFEPGPRRRRWMGDEVTWQHRTIEQWIDALGSAGFALTALRECAPDPSLFDPGDASESAELRRRRRVPLFLLLSATRPGASSPPDRASRKGLDGPT